MIEFGFGKPCQSLIIDEGDINQNYFNQDFLLEAVFELDPYKLSFKKSSDYSDEFVKKIEVNGVDISSTNNVASVGKADIVEIKNYHKTRTVSRLFPKFRPGLSERKALFR